MPARGGRRRNTGKLGDPDDPKAGKLVAANLRTAAPGLHSDGGGLSLQVTPNGRGRSWIFRYAIGGRFREMGLGSLNRVPLAQARQAAKKCWDMVHPMDPDTPPIDPIEHRRSLRAASQVAMVKAAKPSFKKCAQDYIAKQRPSWRNPKHAQQWLSTLYTYVYPVFGDLPVDAVDTELVLQVLEPIWTTKTETATRVRQRVEAILDYAKVRQWREGENPALWRGHLALVLPSPSAVAPARHFRALHYEDIAQFLGKLQQQPGVAARALTFAVLTVARIGSVRNARQTEINLGAGIWTVPPSHLKHKKGQEPPPLRVPLSAPAFAIAEQMMAKYPDSHFLFPGGVPGKPLSDNATRALLQRMGYDAEATTHGFRSTFKDWAHERCTPRFPDDVIEMAMAHAIDDKVEAAYRRGDLFEKRRELMDAWAAFCCPAPAGNVTPFPSRAAG